MVSKLNSPTPEQEFPNTESALSLEDTIAQQLRGVAKRAKSTVSGYNPYDMAPGAPGTSASPAKSSTKPTDLRKLSEWIRLTRQVAALKKDKPED